MKITRGLALAALLGALGTSHAQLKPPPGGLPPLTPSAPAPTAPAATEVEKTAAQGAKELAARGAAEQWLLLLDAGDYGKAWDQCARLFRDRVTRQQWIDSLPKSRGGLGAMKTRRVEVASYKSSLPGVPDGDYVTVRFSTNFANRTDAEELVTLVYEDGVWRPLGYGIG